MQKISDAKEKHTFKALTKSFKYAINGIFIALRICRNLKIHYLFSVLAIAAGFYFELDRIEFSLVLLAITLVITLEMMNTAIERVVDLLTEKYHMLALIAKDVAAGAVLLASIIAFVVGALIFGPHLLELLG